MTVTATTPDLQPWNRSFLLSPADVVSARDAADVARAVRSAADRGLTVAVQATGHGATSDLAGSVLVSTRAMDTVRIDAERRHAVVGPGATWGQVLAAAAPHGLTAPAGSAPHVGVTGYTTGGGVGPLVRSLGPASDRVRALDVVTGDGERRRVSATEHPDLFWALRGGRGMVGIVTSLEIELVAMSQVYAGAVYASGDNAAAVLHRWREWSATLPETATTSVALLRLPDLPQVPPPLAGRLSVAVRFACTENEAAAVRLLAPMRAAAPTLIDSVTTRPATELGPIHNDPVDPMPFRDDHALLHEVAIEALLATAGPDAPPVPGFVEVRQLGGAMANEPAVPSAFPARHAGFALTAVGPAAPPVAAVVADRAARVLAATRSSQVSGGLPTFGVREERAWLEQTYDAATLTQLAEVSRRYDPATTIREAVNLRA